MSESDQDKAKVYTQIDKIRGFTRKPTSWSEVGLPIPMDLLESLPQYNAEELGIHYNIAANFRKPPDTSAFLVGYKDGVYFVDSGGYDYVRSIRYAGSAMPNKRDIVKIVDEHSQPIEITQLCGRYFWSFAEYPERVPKDLAEDNFFVAGPFASRQVAIDDAVTYCNDAAG